jgi:hypothetical protein
MTGLRGGSPGATVWARLEGIFAEAIELPAAERTAFLERACGDDAELHARVATLLEAHEALHTGEAERDGFLAPLDGRVSVLLHELDDDPEEGAVVGRYRIVRPLGQGGMGRVYLARDPALDRPVALKLLPPYLSGDPAANRRLVQEARAASALDHPHIATVYEIGEADDGRLFIAMAYYEGGTLRDRLRGGPLPMEEAVEIAAGVAEGLAAAHARGIVHRDIKPENIIVGSGGGVRIVDFGVAKVAASALTRTGTTSGTVAYMSPEQTSGGTVDHRSDLWALGVVLHEMLAGERPFRGDAHAAVIYGIRNDDPPPLGSLRPEVPPALSAVVERCLVKDPARRFDSAEELAGALRAATVGGSLGAEAAADGRRAERSGKLLGGVETSRRVLHEAALHHGAQRGRHLRAQAAQRRRVVVADAVDHRGVGVTPERPLAGQHLVEHHPQRPEVGAVVHRPARGLLRAHVGHRPRRRAGAGERARGHLGDAEVHDAHPTARTHDDVLGLDVAVHDAACVRGREPLGHARGDLDRLLHRQRPAPQPISQRAPFVVRHGDEEAAVVRLSDLVDGGDVGVIEGGGGPRLLHQPAVRRGIAAQVGRQQLERHRAVQSGVPCQVDPPHPPLPQRADDAVSPHYGALLRIVIQLVQEHGDTAVERRQEAVALRLTGVQRLVRLQQRGHARVQLRIVTARALQEGGALRSRQLDRLGEDPLQARPHRGARRPTSEARHAAPPAGASWSAA